MSGNIVDFSRLTTHAKDTKQLSAGDFLFEIGDDANEMYVVKSGEVDILVDGTCVETVKEGGIMGEMALVDSSPRSADAKCRTDSEIVSIDEKQFTQLVENLPYFALDVMRVMANRLRQMNADQTSF